MKPAHLAPEVTEILAEKRDARHVGNVDPPEHTRLRELLNQAFAPARIARYEPMIERIADDLLDAMGEGPGDLVRDYAYPLALRVVLQVIGIPLRDLDRCYAWSQAKASLDFAHETLSPAEQRAAAHSAVAFLRYCDALVEDRARAPQDDSSAACSQPRRGTARRCRSGTSATCCRCSSTRATRPRPR